MERLHNRIQKLFRFLKAQLVRWLLIRAYVESGLSKNPKATRIWAASEVIRRIRQSPNGRCNTALLSYPRSGNHLVRFVVESCSSRPTLGASDHEKFLLPRQLVDDPIFLRSSTIRVSDRRPILIKRHEPNFNFTRLIFLSRDPVEAILSHISHHGTSHGQERLLAESESYMTNLRAYINHPSEDRILVTLEQIKTQPQVEFSKILDFLQVFDYEDRLASNCGNLDAAYFVLGRKPRPSLFGHYQELMPEEHAFLTAYFSSHMSELEAAGLPYKY